MCFYSISLFLEPPASCAAPVVSDVTKSSCILTWVEPDDGGSSINGQLLIEINFKRVLEWIMTILELLKLYF